VGPVPAGAAPPAPAEGEPEAWAEVLSGWGEDQAHRAYLARFGDLDGLALAGRRYREVLAERPGDATALRWREEILRRAAAHGLARLPRTWPPRELPRGLRRALLAALLAGAAATVGWVVASFLRLGSRP
jgi:hypothetical protein